MVGAYLRVSSRSQDARSQKSAIERAASARGEPIARWWTEKASASTTDRPVLTELRDAARRGEISTLYVFRLDRLTRSGIRDTLALLEELRVHGVRVVTVSDGFTLEGPFSEVVIAVIAWAAQMERLALGERIAAARARVEAAGGSWGRPKRAEAQVVAKVLDLRSRDFTIRAIAARLKIPRATVGAIASEKGAYAAKRKPSRKQPLAKA